MITLLLLVRATYIWVLFFAHIPFMVNRTFNATPTEWLQHSFLQAQMETDSDRAASSLLFWARTEETGAMKRSCQFHRLLALYPQSVEHHLQTIWQVWTLLSRVRRLGKLHRLTTCEEQDTHDRGPRVYHA